MSEHHDGLPGIVTMSLNLLGIFVCLMIGLALYSLVTARPITKTVTINGKGHTVLVANTPVSRYQGLSGKTIEKLGADGMMFTFPTAEQRTFEMRRMLFALDFLWVQDGAIVKLDENIPAPKVNEKPVQVSSKPVSADTVFEFPAGFVNANGIKTGDAVNAR